MTRIITPIALLVALTLPGAARADDFAPEFRLTAAGAAQQATDDSVDWISDSRTLGRVEVGAGVLVAPGLSLYAEFSNRHSETWILDDYENDVLMRTIGARVRYAFDLPFPILRPYLSGGAGVMLAKNRLYAPNATLEDAATAFAFDVAAGLEAQTPGRFSVGLYNDYGYAWRGDLDFSDATPRADDGPSSSVDLGSVRMRGFQWRLGLFLAARF